MTKNSMLPIAQKTAPTSQQVLRGSNLSLIRAASLGLLTAFALALSAEVSKPGPWKSLFNGKDLQGWKINEFAGGGEVKVQDGKIIIGEGAALTGINRTNDLLKSNYEVEVQAMKLDGNDFFAAITFPVKESNATFIDGGWGGSLVGISSLDGQDASENDTTQYVKFEKNKWYTLRVRVTDTKIQAFIDGDKIVDANIKDRKISMRPGEIEEAVPFGITTYQTRSAIREVKIRPIPAKPTKIVMIAGRKSHGPGEHEYEKCLKGLKAELDKIPDLVLDTEVVTLGWPLKEETLDDADTIVLFSDGADHKEEDHPLLHGSRLKVLEQQMNRGAGLVAIHYTVFVPEATGGKKFLQWIGGYFDYQTGEAPNHWYSKIETRDFKVFPASPEHPICKGLTPFDVREEYYFKTRFPENKDGLTPIITFDPEKKDWEKVVGWALQRPDGGRGFGYTGGHFASNWEKPEVRRLLRQAVLWTAKMDGPGLLK